MPLTDNTISILLIDDDPDLRRNLHEILTLAGYKAHLAAHAQAGLNLLDLEKPHLIITDIHLPEMDGIQLLQKIRSHNRWQQMPFIFLSGSQEKLTAIQAQAIPNVIACLIKPFAISDLLHAVERAASAGSIG